MAHFACTSMGMFCVQTFMEYESISRGDDTDLGTSTRHRMVPMVPPTVASSSTRVQSSLWQAMLARETMAPEISREKGVFALALEVSTFATIFPSIESCDRLPPSSSGDATAVDETSSCKLNLTTNRGGSARGLLCSAAPSGAGDLARLLFVLLDALDAFDRIVATPSSKEASKGSNGLSARDIVRRRAWGRIDVSQDFSRKILRLRRAVATVVRIV
mmetsp:Transcript_52873/g.112335  ORF Transcript_52873/g.112335 Transcript_52873/m.112335 type:complete len:217 (+) Transcript_52873:708-1358(+)